MKARVGALVSSALGWARSNPVLPGGRRAGLIGMTLLAVLVVGSGTAVAVDRITAVPAGAVARVGNTVITEQYLAQETSMMTALTGQAPPVDKTLLAKDAVVNQVMADAAAAHGIVIADKTANDKLTELLERTYPRGRDDFTGVLAKAGVPESLVLDEVKRQLAAEQLFEQVTKDVPPPTDQDVAQTYEQRKAEMVIPEKRHVRNIGLMSQEQAKQVRAQLDQGADFATLAKQVSQDEGTKTNGGELGVATRREITDNAFGDAAFAAAPNSVFGPVKSENNVWNVGQVLEVTPPMPLSLEQVRDSLRSRLYALRKFEAFNRFRIDRLKEAHVRYADAYRPADPDSLPGPQLPDADGAPPK
jgi:peptidyl-prolyl cis-trans isomerase C